MVALSPDERRRSSLDLLIDARAARWSREERLRRRIDGLLDQRARQARRILELEQELRRMGREAPELVPPSPAPPGQADEAA